MPEAWRFTVAASKCLTQWGLHEP